MKLVITSKGLRLNQKRKEIDMYADQLITLYLNKSKLKMRDAYGEPLPYEAEVKDYCSHFESDYLQAPDFYLEGFYRHLEGKNGQFIIAEGGPHVLYITGIPQNIESLTPFRLNGEVLYSSYWEQSDKGYLFQILNNNQII